MLVFCLIWMFVNNFWSVTASSWVALHGSFKIKVTQDCWVQVYNVKLRTLLRYTSVYRSFLFPLTIKKNSGDYHLLHVTSFVCLWQLHIIWLTSNPQTLTLSNRFFGLCIVGQNNAAFPWKLIFHIFTNYVWYIFVIRSMHFA